MSLSKGNRLLISNLGLVMIILGLAMLLPMLMGIYDGEKEWYNYGVLSLAAILGGYWAARHFKEEGEITARDGYMLVGLTWVIAGVYGALPFLLHEATPYFGIAFFESVSGFTTTGATAFGDVESLERSLLLWRSLTHWLGGMGIVALFVAISSFLGNSGMQMFKAETTGPIKEKVVPRIRDTAKILWLTYVAVTAFQIIGLILLGMPVFDSVCHAFGAVATGGFSTKNSSIGFYQSPAIDWAITFFMVMSGVNFSLYYLAVKKRTLRCFWKKRGVSSVPFGSGGFLSDLYGLPDSDRGFLRTGPQGQLLSGGLHDYYHRLCNSGFRPMACGLQADFNLCSLYRRLRRFHCRRY